MAKLGLSSPWVIFYNELNAFFARDPLVKVVYDENENVIDLYVEDAEKAAALTELLPTEKDFGAVKLQINVIPANVKYFGKNTYSTTPLTNLYKNALMGNEAVVGIKEIQGIFTNPITYVVFKKEVIQYFNDSLSDIYGQCSTLMQEIAKNIFANQTGIYFCTDKF